MHFVLKYLKGVGFTVREIIHDPVLLSRKSAAATKEDFRTVTDLSDTLSANSSACVGMAANMIGVLKRIIVFYDKGKCKVMQNPEIIFAKGKYETREGCLSLSGTRSTERFKQIKVKYRDENFRERICSFSGFTAEIIQHEIDHCNGILI